MNCIHFKKILTEEDRYFVSCSESNNCMFCLIDERGPMTQEEVGDILGLCKMRVCQLEKKALKNFQRKMKVLEIFMI